MLREHTNFVIEYLPCEIMRRFACGLAYARHLVRDLLKGGFDIAAHHEQSGMRSLHTIRLRTALHRLWTRSVSFALERSL